MAILTQTIPTPQPRAIATFDAIDFADGTGKVTFQIFNTLVKGGTRAYVLGRDIVYSNDILHSGGQETVSCILTAFNAPRTVRGTAFVSIGISANGAGAYVQLQVFKNADSISSVVETFPTVGANAQNGQMFLVPIPLTETQFGEGDQLILKITNKPEGTTMTYGHDPIGRLTGVWSGEKVTTKLQFIVPFRIRD